MSQPPGAEVEVERIRGLIQERHFAQAAAAAGVQLTCLPEHREFLYLQALAQRMLGDIPAALATLERLESLYPRFSRLFQERGQCHVALRQAPQAIEAFMRGVR